MGTLKSLAEFTALYFLKGVFMLIGEDFKQKIEAIKTDYNKWLEELTNTHGLARGVV